MLPSTAATTRPATDSSVSDSVNVAAAAAAASALQVMLLLPCFNPFRCLHSRVTAAAAAAAAAAVRPISKKWSASTHGVYDTQQQKSSDDKVEVSTLLFLCVFFQISTLALECTTAAHSGKVFRSVSPPGAIQKTTKKHDCLIDKA